jgi:cardiolipin synthase
LIGLSDALDGFLARKYNAVTNFGTIIDPFVDRTVFIILIFWFKPILSSFFFWGIIIRDIAVLLGSIFILKKAKTINVSHIGKFTTVLLFVNICFYVLSTNINIGNFTNYLSYFAISMYYYVALEYLYKQVLFSE